MEVQTASLPSMPVRITNGIVALLFFLFAGFQLNDVDPEVYHNPSKMDAAIWLLFYFFIGVMLIAVIFRKIPGWILLIGVIACVVQMAISGPGLYQNLFCLLYTSPSPRDQRGSRMPSSA